MIPTKEEAFTSGALFPAANSAAYRSAYLPPDPECSAFVIFDPVHDQVLHSTRGVSLLTGYTREELSTMPGSRLFGDAGRALLAGVHDRMLTAGPGMVWGQYLPVFDAAGVRRDFFATLRLPAAPCHRRFESCQVIVLDPGEVGQDGLPRETGPNPRFVMEALQDNLWEYHVREGVFFYSPQFAEIFGPEGVAGNRGKKYEAWSSAVHPDDVEHVMTQWRRLLKMGERYRLPYRIRDARGRWRWILSGIHAILNDPAGRADRVLGFHIDISSAMALERDVTETGERFRTVFNNVGVGIAVCEKDGTVVKVNAAMAVVLGRDREYFIGKKLALFAHSEDRWEIRANLTRLAKNGRRERMRDKRFLRPDGGIVWANVTATLSEKILGGERYVIVMVEDVTPFRAEREKLQYEATHDVMTGCWNRWVLLERLEQHMRISQRHSQSMAFALCDLDRFKQVNDVHGHQAGDQVLVRFVQILRDAVRETEVVGRYGGEEFAIVFPGTSVAGAHLSLERALDELHAEEFVDDSGSSFRVTASFGISGVTPDCSMKDVITWADTALYQAKTRGRNRIVCARRGKGGGWL